MVTQHHPVVRIFADDGPYDCEVEIAASDDDWFCAVFAATRAEAVKAAVAKFRSHRRWLRSQRKGAPVTPRSKILDNDPILQMSKWAQDDIHAARAAESLANVAARFRVDEPDNDVVPRDANGSEVAA